MNRGLATGVGIPVTLVVFIIAGSFLWQAKSKSLPPKPYAGQVEKLTISTLPIYTPGLLLVAQDQGYFRDNGLDVTLKFFPTGPMGIELLKAGQVDIAHVSDFVLVQRIFSGEESLRCLASIAESDINRVIARKDRGIQKPSDLKGKIIGVPCGTIAEFFLGRFLTFHQLLLSNVKILSLSPQVMAASLENGTVDAVMVWDPVTYDLVRLMGGKLFVWPGQSGQKFYNVLVSTDQSAQANPAALDRLFRALVQAESFITANREKTLAIIAEQIEVDQSLFREDCLKTKYSLTLDQGLLITMEDEGRWMITNGMTRQKVVPNYLNYINAAALSKVKPDAVTMIIPPFKADERKNKIN